MATPPVGRALPLALALGLAACSGAFDGLPDGGLGSPGGATSANPLVARVQPELDYCRTCHVPGGVADTDEGRGLLLSRERSEDETRLHASWDRLGRGVETNPILTHASGEAPHSGGSPWPRGGEPYEAMRALLACWDADPPCSPPPR